MKIVHMADTHLGFTAYHRMSENGFNQREEDISLAFVQAIDKIITLKPDLVLHSGDLFDAVRPSNRILHFAIRQILRLAEARIPIIIISGNHDTPKHRFVGSVFSIFELLSSDFIKVIYQNKYEAVKFNNTTIHAVPQCTYPEILKAELEKIKLDSSTKNILMLHVGVTGIREFMHGDFNEQLVDTSFFEKKSFDYVALGHYHAYTPVIGNAYYSGSTERQSFNEVGQPKGFLEVDLDSKKSPIFHELSIRPMIEPSPIDATGKDSEALMAEIEEKIKKLDPKGKIMRLKVLKIPSHIYQSLDFRKINELAEGAAHFEPAFEKLDEKGEVEILKTSIGRLNEEFIAYIESLSEQKDKEGLKTLGLEYLEKVVKE